VWGAWFSRFAGGTTEMADDRGSPCFARGTNWARFPLLAGGTYKEGVYTNRADRIHTLLRVQNPPTPCPLPP
jgi:hypothetical protein